ncbi:MAG: DNA mismatch repair endonuclease MutL [Planctomycetota bacterium]
MITASQDSSSLTMEPPRIAQLSPHLVNQIAAGEVIERPASVVKELVENAIDAHAGAVTIELEQGGLRTIRIIDDGCGINPADLVLAVSSHATSKLRGEAELHAIRTLGFRGEALASIASVAELELVSRPRAASAGERVVAREGRVEPGSPEPLAPGTRVTVRNLFYNVPARKRFLKSERAELLRIRALVDVIALAHPELGITLTNDGKLVARYAREQAITERLAEVFGAETAARLLPIASNDDDQLLTGFVGRPDLHRRTSDGVHLFLNGRPIKDRTVLHALREAYSGFQIPGRYPIAVLRITIEPSEFDVNVHPTKQEVRFRDSSAIHRLVMSRVRGVLERTGSVPDLISSTPTIGGSEMREWRGSAITSRSFPARPYTVPAAHTMAGAVGEDASAARVVEPARELVDGRELRVTQVRNAYLIVEEDAGLCIIDQHALHEKILYEQLSVAYERGSLRQPLLIPETVELAARELECLSECAAELYAAGFDLEEFGGRTVLIRALPAGFENRAPVGFVREVLAQLGEARERGSLTAIELRGRLIATLACKRAVKAGDRLTPEEQLDLVRGRAQAFQPQNCPHGRPAELFLSWEELARRFDRR